MQVSVREALSASRRAEATEDLRKVDAAAIRLLDAELIARVTAAVAEIPDRTDRVDALRVQVESGTYRRSGEEIAVAMARRALADRSGD